MKGKCSRCGGKGYFFIEVTECHFTEEEGRPCPECNKRNKKRIYIPNSNW